MNPITLEEFHSDPAQRRRLYEMAHRERARAVRAGLTWLRRKIAARLAPHLYVRPARWIERLG